MTVRAFAWAVAAWLLLGAAGPAAALTICSGPCPTQPPPAGGSITIPPGVLPPVVVVSGSDIVTVPSGGSFSQTFDRDVLVGVPADGIQLHDFSLNAAGDIFVTDTAQVDTSGTRSISAGGNVTLCVGNTCSGGTAPTDPALVLLPSIAGDVAIGSTGNIALFTVPEAPAAWLLLLGGVAVVRLRK